MIVYLAAISGIDMDQYEAAELDGASHFQKLIHITLPNLMPTIIVMFIMCVYPFLQKHFAKGIMLGAIKA